MTIKDTLVSDTSVENIFFSDIYDEEATKCLDKLSKVQKNIVNLLVLEYKPFEIRTILQITQHQYKRSINIIRKNCEILLVRNK